MKILIVSKAFYPMNSPRSFRTTELATELRYQGHSVTLAIPVDHQETVSYCQEKDINLIDLGKTRWPEIAIRGSIPVRMFRRVLGRFLSQLFEYPRIEVYRKIINGLKEISNYDLAITIASPHAVHWGFASLLRQNRQLCKCWIADCGDPFMGVQIDTFKKAFYFKYFEKHFCRTADFITVPIEGARDAYYPEFHTKIRVIPQGFRFPDENFWPEYVRNPIPTFAFAGSFIPGVRDPRPLLDYLLEFSGAFRFICYSRQPDMLAGYQNRMGERLQVSEFLPRHELLKTLRRMDFLINLENGTGRQTPSKLIDYALANRPILSLNTNKLNRVAINEFMSGNYTQKLPAPNIESFNIENITRQFVRLAETHLSYSRDK